MQPIAKDCVPTEPLDIVTKSHSSIVRMFPFFQPPDPSLLKPNKSFQIF